MSKTYNVDMNLDTSKFSPNGGFLMYAVDKEVDPRGFKERLGKEIFCYLASAAISGANQRCGYDELKGFRRVQKMLDDAANGTGLLVCNKTEIDVIKNSIRGNRNWVNSDEMLAVLDAIIERLNECLESN